MSKHGVPSSYQANRLDRDVLGVGPLRTDLFGLVNQGQLIVNYLGHGSTYIWGQTGELLTTADIPANWSTTGSRLPFVVAMNCLNGFFQGIYGEESLAETLLRASGGGAVAVWASSSLTEAEPQGLMNDELFRLVFNGSQATLGDAVTAAKGAVADIDVRRSWVFFGDPAMSSRTCPSSPIRPRCCRRSRRRQSRSELRRGHVGWAVDVGDAEPVGSGDTIRRRHGDLDGDGRSAVDSDHGRFRHGERTLHGRPLGHRPAAERLGHRDRDRSPPPARRARRR